MKNLLAVFDGYHPAESTLQYAIALTKRLQAQLTGVFLDEFIYRSYNVTAVMTTVDDYEKVLATMDREDQEKREVAVRQFQEASDRAGIRYRVHRDRNLALQDLKEESMFAYLVVINADETFSRHKEEPPTHFMKDLLGDVQCPVLVVPKQYKEIDKIVLLYDGGPSSVYTIKSFHSLVGELERLPVEVFTVNDRLENLRLPDNKRMREFILRCFPQASFVVTMGDATEQILGHLRNHQENELVVLGAYRRSELSRWFKRSLADILMKELETPLFIAHH